MYHYGVDLAKVILGEGPAPSLVLALVQRLPEDSLTAALASGGRELVSWNRTNRILADIFDAINLNTKATGNWKNKAPDFPMMPRPKISTPATEDQPKPRVRVADLYRKFSGGK